MPEEANKSQIFLIERRRAERLLVNVPVEVTFETGDSSPSKERTFIEDVSDFGCRFTTRTAAHQGDRVALKFIGGAGKSLANDGTRHYEIMWVAQQGKKSTVGARLIQGEKPVEIDLLKGESASAPSK